MQFNPLFLSLAATFALVQAGPVAAPHEARAALENRQAGCLQGSCLDCTQYCYENFRGPDRTTSMQRLGCSMGCLSLCNDC